MIEIEKIKNNNFNEWLPLWNGYLEFYNTSLAPEITDVVFNRLCDPNEPNMGGFLAYEGDKAFPKKCDAVFGQETQQKENRAIGLVHYIIHRGTWSNKDVCYLEDLFVAPNVRGGGVGRALINAVADFARENNLRHVYWMTQNNNSRARLLYDNIAGQSEFVVYKLGLK